MREVGAVIDTLGNVAYWHAPDDATTIALPDSMKLWDEIWRLHQRGRFAGFAHSHPGTGCPAPSYTDITTFAAIERGLGVRPVWWITSSDCLIAIRYQPVVLPWPHRFHGYSGVTEGGYGSIDIEPVLGEQVLAPWVTELRQRSSYDR